MPCDQIASDRVADIQHVLFLTSLLFPKNLQVIDTKSKILHLCSDFFNAIITLMV